MTLKFPDSFWAHTATPAELNPPLTKSIKTDVVIIGAGFTGLRAALTLAEASTQVTVLDAADVGWGASGRTGGQVNPMLPFNTPDKIRQLVGDTHFELLTQASLGSADELFDLIRKHDIDCQARQNGWLRVDHTPKVQALSVANAETWNQYGAEMIPVDADEVEKISGTSAYYSGVVVPKGGAVQPLSLARGLARRAKELGAKIYGNSPVSSIKHGNTGWTVSTPNGQVNADWVVLATNGYTDKLFTGLADTIMPIHPIQIASDSLTDEQIGAILPQGHTISDTRRVIMYSRREPGNRLVFGGHGKMQSNGQSSGFEWLIKDVERIWPSLKGVNWQFRWGGNIALTADRLPHLHEPEKGLIAGLGYNGRGVAMSHVMGRVMAERVLGAMPETLPFPVTDVKKYPFRSTQLMGEGTAVSWMRFLDSLETRKS